MKSAKIVLMATVLLIGAISCKPDKDDYTEKWVGEWQTTDDTTFPQTKYLHTGTIIKDNETNNQVIMTGILFGLNSSYKIPVKLSSESRGTIDYTNGFTMKGSAISNEKDTIWVRINISQNNRTVYDTVTLVKVK